ncbi:hypothetical protein EOM09_07925 [bacterium]|nr:hypothetical protein [bacterium]
MNIKTLIDKVINLEFLTLSEGVQLYNNLPLSELTYIADLIRNQLHPLPEVTWIIDRNVNIGNICISNCMFCNFCRPFNSSEAYTTTIDEYIKKINELNIKNDELTKSFIENSISKQVLERSS